MMLGFSQVFMLANVTKAFLKQEIKIKPERLGVTDFSFKVGQKLKEAVKTLGVGFSNLIKTFKNIVRMKQITKSYKMIVKASTELDRNDSHFPFVYGAVASLFQQLPVRRSRVCLQTRQ